MKRVSSVTNMMKTHKKRSVDSDVPVSMMMDYSQHQPQDDNVASMIKHLSKKDENSPWKNLKSLTHADAFKMFGIDGTNEQSAFINTAMREHALYVDKTHFYLREQYNEDLKNDLTVLVAATSNLWNEVVHLIRVRTGETTSLARVHARAKEEAEVRFGGDGKLIVPSARPFGLGDDREEALIKIACETFQNLRTLVDPKNNLFHEESVTKHTREISQAKLLEVKC